MSINTTIQNLAQFLVKTPEFHSIEAERQSAGRLNLAPGQQVQAEILANQPNHRTLVRIAGELLRMELPINVQPGETLAMTFVAEEPRLTFTMSRSANNATPVTISDTGKLLGMLARTGAGQHAEALPRINTILDGPPADSAALATRLREALTLSGVFYESHLVQWALGERALKDILREPQAKSAPRAKPAESGKIGHNRTQPDATDVIRPNSGKASDGTEAAEGGNSRSPQVEPEMLGILREQMHALHTGRFVWQGEAWPGQQMEWTVSEREPEPGEKQDREWETTLRLEFPKLGEVNATLLLTGEGLRLRIRTSSDSAAAAMESGRQDLAEAMAAAGIRFAGMVVD